jgi:hypothetical protein
MTGATGDGGVELRLCFSISDKSHKALCHQRPHVIRTRKEKGEKTKRVSNIGISSCMCTNR